MDIQSILPKLNTSERIEFADVRNLVTLKQLTDYLAIQLSNKKDSESRGKCPKCSKDNLSINLESKYFKCFSKNCTMKGSGVIDFLNKGYSINNSVTSAHIIAFIFKILIYAEQGSREVGKVEAVKQEVTQPPPAQDFTEFEKEVLQIGYVIIEELQTIVRLLSKNE